MMHWLAIYGLFLLKTITLVAAALILLAGIIALSSKEKLNKNKLKITDLREKYDGYEQEIKSLTLNKKQLKAFKKQKKQSAKQSPPDKTIFVIYFNGDVTASQAAPLQEMITAVITSATADQDEVVLCLESAGGLVHSYGLAASQLTRLKNHGIKLTVIVDKVAASGGYMMACIADQLLAAPFAILGSIGVVMQLPNFNRLLKKHNIDFEQLTAGEYKRTLTLFGENTEPGREKMQNELEETHELFKAFIEKYRPQVDLATVATGAHWYGQQALSLQLIDAIKTSDDYLFEAAKTAKLYRIDYKQKQALIKKLLQAGQSYLGRLNT